MRVIGAFSTASSGSRKLARGAQSTERSSAIGLQAIANSYARRAQDLGRPFGSAVGKRPRPRRGSHDPPEDRLGAAPCRGPQGRFGKTFLGVREKGS